MVLKSVLSMYQIKHKIQLNDVLNGNNYSIEKVWKQVLKFIVCTHCTVLNGNKFRLYGYEKLNRNIFCLFLAVTLDCHSTLT